LLNTIADFENVGGLERLEKVGQSNNRGKPVADYHFNGKSGS
jgi:hypothetical protein